MMNILGRNCKRIITSLLTDVGDLSKRYLATVADYNINWERPKVPSKTSAERTGDLGLKIDVKPTNVGYKYADSPELKDASDIVKKMFTLHYLRGVETTRMKKLQIMEMVKRNQIDHTSPEIHIAACTSRIFELQEKLKQYPRNSKLKVQLNTSIDKRRKWLKHLRTWDYKRFEWILERLNLVYKPLPSPPLQITRKESLTRLTNKYCYKIKQNKLNNYKNELKGMQKNFYIEKAKKLAFIRKEELECGLEPSVSEEDLAKAEEKAKEYQT